MSGSRLRRIAVLSGIAIAGLALLSWSQPWFQVTLMTGLVLDVRGEQSAPALSALAFAALALSAALTIAGRVLRYLLGVVEVVIGLLMAGIALATGRDPVAASSSMITEATAVAGSESVRELVVDVAATPFPAVAIVAGVLLTLVGALVLVTARRWPDSSRRYEPTGADTTSTSGAWDALTDGSDPTR